MVSLLPFTGTDEVQATVRNEKIKARNIQKRDKISFLKLYTSLIDQIVYGLIIAVGHGFPSAVIFADIVFTPADFCCGAV